MLIKGITGSPISCNLLHMALKPSEANENSGECVTIVRATCDNSNEQLILTLPVVYQLYANVQSSVNQFGENSGVRDSLCNLYRVDINNGDYIDATVAVTTRAQSKSNVVEDVNVDKVDNNCDSFCGVDDSRDSDHPFDDVDDVTSLRNECGIGHCTEFATEQKTSSQCLMHLSEQVKIKAITY